APLDPARRAGAIVDRRQTAGILAAIERAQGEGATLLGGGRQLTINCSENFIEPTLFGGVRPYIKLAREEIFRPVQAISALDSEDEAISLANDSRYGLAASLRIDDMHRAHREARRLNA
ncbi:aldehyde dehydrogenase family protein, partial [Pseudomonas aeruginosa]